MQMFLSIYAQYELFRIFVYMDKSVVLLYILLGGLSRASMSIYQQFPRFFCFEAFRKNIIYFSDVIHIIEIHGRLEVLLRNGCVYLLSGNTSSWELIDFCPKKSHPDVNSFLFWYWIFSGNLQLFLSSQINQLTL